MKINSKLALAVLAFHVVLILQNVTGHQQCLYCKRADTQAGFMYNYYYCGDEDNIKCIDDYDNII